MALLRDDTLRNEGRWRMEGFTNREIAQKLGIIEQSVERKLKSIRQTWSKELAP